MTFDYLDAGLHPAMLTAGLLALIFMLITAHRAAYNLREMDEFIVLCSLGVSAFTSLFCMFYPVANLFNLARQQPDLWASLQHLDAAIRMELTQGVLAMRVTSMAVGINATRSLLEALRLDPLPTNQEATKRLYRFKEAEQVNANELSVYRNRFAQTAINLVQAGFYELNILLLWNLKLADISDTGSLLLAWALFYIIDDWRIIFRLSLALKGRFMQEHLRQVRNTNWIITLAGAWCAWHWSFPGLVVYLFCSYVLHRLLVFVAYGIRGNWKIPGALDWKYFDEKVDHETGARK